MLVNFFPSIESTRTKVEVMKPVLLKAGIPLAISLAGIIIARISTRKNSVSKVSSSENHVDVLASDDSDPRDEISDEESFHSLDSFSFPVEDEEQKSITAIRDRSYVEEEILGLRCRIEELRAREWKIEARFLHFCKMKEQEQVLMEIQNNLLLEIARAEFLGREASYMEADNHRFEELVVENLRILGQLEFERRGNRMLHKKVKKLSRKIKCMSCVMRERNRKIENREAEFSRVHRELERTAENFKVLEGENAALQSVIDELQKEKKELLQKAELAENSASSKIETEWVASDDYKRLADELEQLQKDRVLEVKELVFLRWCNACLRHELTRRNQEQQEQIEEQNDKLVLENGGNGEMEHISLENELDGETTGAQAHSRRPKLMQKIKRWVEGSKKMKQKWNENEKTHQGKCFRRYLVSDGAEEPQIPPRNSCSSARMQEF